MWNGYAEAKGSDPIADIKKGQRFLISRWNEQDSTVDIMINGYRHTMTFELFHKDFNKRSGL